MNKLVKEVGVILDYGDRYHEVHINMEEITRKRKFTQEKIDKVIKIIDIELSNVDDLDIIMCIDKLREIKDILEEEII